MDNEERKEMIDGIQKDITSVCFKRCYSTKEHSMDIQCFDLCYQKYKLVLRDTTTILKDIGIKLHSDVAYKAFPEENPWFIAYHNGIFLTPKRGIPSQFDFVNFRVS